MNDPIVTGHWNIPWLRGLPANWQVVSSKRLFSVRKELARPDDQQLAATQAYGVISQKEFERRVGRRVVQITRNLDKRRHVERDDFVISMRSFEGGLERAWDEGCIRSSYVVLKPNAEVDVGYFQYLFKSHDYIQALRATSNFIRDGQDLNLSNFVLVDLPLPPPDVQRLIARFLHWHGGQTSKLIRAKKKIITLLNEQKQAIIHRAVTRGFDPNAKLQPSGIPWLGDVPESWEVKRLKWAMRLQRGFDLPADKRIAGPHPVVSSGGIIDHHTEYKVEGPGVVMGRYGSTDAVFYIEDNFWPHNTSLFVTDFRGNDRWWCFYVLRTISKQDHSSKAAVPGVDRKDLFDIVLAVPSPSEQIDIVRAIEDRSRELDQAITSISLEIGYIQEFRTRLIADVVTGKLDVRTAAASLPEIAELKVPDILDDDLAEDDLDEAIDDAENEEVAA